MYTEVAVTEKEAEIGKRVSRLSELRGQLTLARSRIKEEQNRLHNASRKALKIISEDDGPLQDLSWPTPDEIRHLSSNVKKVEKEVELLTGELKNFGVDADLFQIKGY